MNAIVECSGIASFFQLEESLSSRGFDLDLEPVEVCGGILLKIMLPPLSSAEDSESESDWTDKCFSY